MRASILLKENIDALLRDRRQTRKDLAQWCRRTESWISKIFRSQTREVPQKYLDRIASFFGMAPYELFRPGIERTSERRITERRIGGERRQAQSIRVARDLGATIDAARYGGLVSPTSPPIQRILAETARRLAAAYRAEAERKTTTPQRRRARQRP